MYWHFLASKRVDFSSILDTPRVCSLKILLVAALIPEDVIATFSFSVSIFLSVSRMYSASP